MSLEKYRKMIEDIDIKMMDLFEKRMQVSLLIGKYKKDHQLPILDNSREIEILNKRKQQLNNDELWPHYESFIKEIMRLSKEYQK
ncbi:chorismate mutase [Peloplasma aerotolerans]|uniref:Chorismate mutase n=1 Tax=Peloplasma aerotolerans TaxID=3044389 RepID=A0AAW6U457_9MOLU|nr:chorismate mutase [Mariniplasma sp. M4Ah]MDI6452677.1 chorismate mutase [Mariniplasma sp. M4Ah]